MEELLAAKAQEETDEVPRALAAYSRARSGAASYAIMAGRETLRMYATAGVDWERLSEDELPAASFASDTSLILTSSPAAAASPSLLTSSSTPSTSPNAFLTGTHRVARRSAASAQPDTASLRDDPLLDDIVSEAVLNTRPADADRATRKSLANEMRTGARFLATWPCECRRASSGGCGRGSAD